MHLTQRMEQFNVAYIHAMAAQAGLNPSQPAVDDDSVDLQLSAKNWVGGSRRSPMIQLQLKCTAAATVANGVIKFALPIKNYDDLRATDLMLPRYLAVMRVPQDDATWIQHNADHMALLNDCYWVSLRGLPETTNTATVTVDIPLTQRLTTESLRGLLSLASQAEPA